MISISTPLSVYPGSSTSYIVRVFLKQLNGFSPAVPVVQDAVRDEPQKRKQMNGLLARSASEEGNDLKFSVAKRRRTTIGRPTQSNKASGTSSC